MIDQTQMVGPLQSRSLPNLIIVDLMGQPDDGLYDVLGNLRLPPCSTAAPLTFMRASSAGLELKMEALGREKEGGK